MIEATIVGAGVIGSSVAYRLAQAGARVTVVDAEGVAVGTTSATFAWTNSNAKLPRAYHDLNVAGMRAHAALGGELGDTPWLHGGGNVEWFAEEEARAEQRRKVERLRQWGYAAEWISPAQLAELEPDLALEAAGDAPIAFYPDEGWLDAVAYTHAMMAAAVRRGAVLRVGARVVQVAVAGGRVQGVVTASGERFAADVVVDCAGPGADTVAALAGLRLPLAPTRGLLVVTPPVAARLSRLVHAPGCNLRPDGAGRLMLHGDAADAAVNAGDTAAATGQIAQDLVRAAATLLPAIAGAAPGAVRVGTRAIPADGLSAVGFLPGVEGFYAVVTHSGVTLAPYLARLAADEIVGGQVVAALAPFRPRRLL